MAERGTGLHGVNDVGSAEKENAGRIEDSRPNIQWPSKSCRKVAVIPPMSRSKSSEMSPPQSPASISPTTISPDDPSSPISSRHVIRRNCTRLRPFSFDLRDSMRRVAHEQKLTRLRELDILYPAHPFTANPVRKYKPLVLQKSSRKLTIPRSPFSSRDDPWN
ncbi:hypothetical protein KOW79_012744 [Hemibagrus wyckioides]|uniref:Uncharacterized protein n=2 Tax=Hemibagrus wyckioides TaxID=337641 RepID=A0A9D3NLI1_9TELE|nr:hypothetical protein KOW79_012744 [Hemibagrus wyckioides]